MTYDDVHNEPSTKAPSIEPDRSGLSPVKITVLEVTFNDRLAAEYAPEGYAPCKRHSEGQVFYTNGWEKPEELCDNAWNALREYTLAIAHGAGYIYGKGGYTNQPGMVIVSCNDGIRPVIFKVERAADNAQ